DEEEATPRVTSTPTPEANATPVVHVIEAGDTLLAIANIYGVDPDLLASENGITNPNALRLGQELTIPFTEEELAAYNAGLDPSEIRAGQEDEPTTTASDEESGVSDTGESNTGTSASPADSGSSSGAAAVSGRIVYPAFNPAINSFDVWMYNIDTGEQTLIADNASQPAFNRDGSLLAYRSWGLASRGIFFRDFVGGRGGQVTRFVEDGLPTWAPDGFSFAFASRREGDRAARLFRGDQQGDGDLAIGFLGEYPTAFPDGRLIAKGCSITGDCGLYVMGANGGGETKISSDTGDTAPAVSPDGNRIAIMSSGRGATNWEIWLINPDGSNPVRLTENGSNEGLPAWSPDGKSIAYASDQGGAWALWVMNADGSNQRKLANMSGSPDGTVLHDAPNSRGWVEERISWAP
ncbi:MAG: LysM peptidoglycan-binding domain-containing protein, partial [Anaerolineae bacterium]|nr:LysM peptidoglycan-binding domain-containing protein [Anaerolineae bacterium]